MCEERFATIDNLTEHTKSKHMNDGDWRCDGCSYQTNTKENLKKHIDITHHTSHQIPPEQISSPGGETIKCYFCTEHFKTNRDMMNHRKKSHRTFKPCRNIPDCPFQEKCLFNHVTLDNNSFICYECGEQFKTLNDLMIHRKTQHKSIQCLKFSKNECKFASDKCWYNHKDIKTTKESPNEVLSPMETSDDEQVVKLPVFQQASANLAPPWNQTTPAPTQATWIKMMSMMTDLNRMMQSMKKFQ